MHAPSLLLSLSLLSGTAFSTVFDRRQVWTPPTTKEECIARYGVYDIWEGPCEKLSASTYLLFETEV